MKRALPLLHMAKPNGSVGDAHADCAFLVAPKTGPGVPKSTTHSKGVNSYWMQLAPELRTMIQLCLVATVCVFFGCWIAGAFKTAQRAVYADREIACKDTEAFGRCHVRNSGPLDATLRVYCEVADALCNTDPIIATVTLTVKLLASQVIWVLPASLQALVSGLLSGPGFLLGGATLHALGPWLSFSASHAFTWATQRLLSALWRPATPGRSKPNDTCEGVVDTEMPRDTKASA